MPYNKNNIVMIILCTNIINFISLLVLNKIIYNINYIDIFIIFLIHLLISIVKNKYNNITMLNHYNIIEGSILFTILYCYLFTKTIDIYKVVPIISCILGYRFISNMRNKKNSL